MNIPKAIKTQEIYLKGDEAVDHDELIEAMKLGNEALKREQEWRERYPGIAIQPLPGETED